MNLVFSNNVIISKILYFCQDPFEMRRINRSFYITHKKGLITYLGGALKGPTLFELYFTYMCGRLIYTPNGFFYFQKHRWNLIWDVVLTKYLLKMERILNIKFLNREDFIIDELKKHLCVDAPFNIDSTKWIFSNGVFDISNSQLRDGVPGDCLTFGVSKPYEYFRPKEKTIQLFSTLFQTENDLQLFLEFAKDIARDQKRKISLKGEGSKLLKRVIKVAFDDYALIYGNRWKSTPFIPKVTICTFKNLLDSKKEIDRVCVIGKVLPIGYRSLNTCKKLPNLSYKDEIKNMGLYLRGIILRDDKI
jgi:hypothetical protein